MRAEIDALCKHLRGLGLDATVESKETPKHGTLVGLVPTFLLGSVKVANRNVDQVELVLSKVDRGYSETTVYDNFYHCHYVVKTDAHGLEDRLRVKSKPIRTGFLNREIVGVKWEGKALNSQALADALNGDPDLSQNHVLYQSQSIEIEPCKRDQCVRIEPGQPHQRSPEPVFPSLLEFEVYDRIAGHIRRVT